ncbi:MAG: HTTM domain-containing protein [Myxococcota bacterium]
MTLWYRFVTWLWTQEIGTPLAVFRILFGLTLLWDLIDIGLSGALEMLWLPEPIGYRMPSPRKLMGFETPTSVSGILWGYGITVTAVTALSVGVGARGAAFLSLLGTQYLLSLNTSAFGGHDRVFTNGLFLLIFARSDETLSLSCWLRNRQWTSIQPVPAWPRYLMVYQLVMIYVFTGVQKLGAVWWPMGELLAVHYALLLPHYARGDWWWVAWLSPLTKAASLITVVWEMTWWVVLLWFWLNRTADRGGRLRRLAERFDLRLLYILIGVGMHGTVWLMMNLGPFSAVTLSFYAVLFRHDEFLAGWQRLRRVINRAPAAPRSG